MMQSPQKKIKVTFIINDFIVGGAQYLLINLMTRMDPKRFEFSLITLFHFGDDEKDYLYRELPPGIPVYRLRFRGFRDFGAWVSLYRALRAINPDVVSTHLFFSNTVVRVLKPLFRYRAISAEHNTYVDKTKLQQLTDRILSYLTVRTIALTKTVVNFTVAQEGIRPSKFIIISGGIDTKQLRADLAASNPAVLRKEIGLRPEDRVIVNVSRFVPQKNHRLMLEGFSLFAPAHPHHRLVLVGGSEDGVDKLKAYARELGIADRALFLGYQKNIPAILGISDFFVSTSLIEGFGIAHAEALACGLPLLTTKTAGPDEMVQEGINGFFIPEYTKEAVAASLARMADQDISAMRAAAPGSVERYSLDRAVQSYERLFEETAV